MAIEGTKIFLFMFPVLGFQVISSNYFQSIGQARISMFLSLLRQVILLIPCLLILPHIGNFGLMGVWLSGPVADGLASIITGIVFFSSIRKLHVVSSDNYTRDRVSSASEGA